jgi:iron(III) transport system permease protein
VRKWMISVASGIIIPILGWLFYKPLRLFGQDFGDLFRDHRLMVIYGKSLYCAGGVAAIAFVSGILLAYFLFETELPGRVVAETVYYWPLILPPYFLATAWLSWFGDFGLLKNPFLKITGEWGGIFLLTLYLIPIMIIAIGNSQSQFMAEQKEAALMMGGHFKYFCRIWLPRSLPAALGGGFLVFIFAINNYAIPTILGLHTVITEIYAEFGAFYNYYRALVKIFPVLSFIGLAFFIVRQGFDRSITNESISRRLYPQDRRAALRWAGSGCWLSYLLLALLIPILGLFLKIGSWQNIAKTLHLTWEQIQFSLWFNMLSGFLIALFGLILVYIVNRHKINWPVPILFGLLILPPVFVGISLIFLFNRPFLEFIYNNGGLLFTGYVARFLPVIFILLLPTVQAIPRNLEEASRLLGRNFWQTGAKIFFPLIFPAFLMAWLIAFFLCNGEAECSILLYPPGVETISIRILSLLHYGTSPTVNSLVFIQLCILAIVAITINGLHHYFFKTRKRDQTE